VITDLIMSLVVGGVGGFLGVMGCDLGGASCG
jgi:hypothetical protein